MKQIKIGTLVRVKEDLETEKAYGGIVFSDEMERFKGKTGRIFKVFKQRVVGKKVFQIEGFKAINADLMDLMYKVFLKDDEYLPSHYVFSREMLEIVDEDEADETIEGEVKITVDEDKLREQIKDDFFKGIPNKSLKTEITVTQNKDGSFSSQMLLALTENYPPVNYAMFMSMLKGVKNIAERLIESNCFSKEDNELFNKYKDIIEEDVNKYEIKGDIF